MNLQFSKMSAFITPTDYNDAVTVFMNTKCSRPTLLTTAHGGIEIYRCRLQCKKR